MNTPSETAIPLENGMNLLVKGKIVSLHQNGNDLNLKVEHSDLAGRVKPGFHLFFAVLKECKDLGLSMSQNTDLRIENPEEIADLSLVIRGAAMSPNGVVNVACRIHGEGPACFLRIKAKEMFIFDEEFDPLGIEQMRACWEPSR